MKPSLVVPRCFPDEKSYKVWLAHAKISHLTLSEDAHCTDCTLTYQRKMITERRCAHPTKSFEEENDDA